MDTHDSKQPALHAKVSGKVAIIDDERLSSHNLGVKLRFVGEETVLLSSANWREHFASPAAREQIYTLVVGTVREGAQRQILEGLRELGLNIPTLLTGGREFYEQLEPALKKPVLAVFERPIHYLSLLESLNRARHLAGLPPKQFKSVLISETGTAMFRSLVGNSSALHRVRELIRQVGPRMVPVLVYGESGTGKEIVARHLHYVSGRTGPFVAVNSATLSLESFSSVLYGRERGEKSSGAPGLVEKARGGTLFLDVIDEMPSAVQAQLLRFLEQRPGGGGDDADVRIVAATRSSLEDRIARGEFREDLFYRLNVFPLELPPLRERAEDIPDLLNELVSRLEKENGYTVRFNTPACLSLQRHPWPGNVRELANLVERLSIVRPDQIIGVSDLPASYQHVSDDEIARMEAQQQGEESSADETKLAAKDTDDALEGLGYLDQMNAESLKRYLANFEKGLIEVALEDCAGNLKHAAEHLQTSPGQLDQLMKKYGLNVTVNGASASDKRH